MKKKYFVLIIILLLIPIILIAFSFLKLKSEQPISLTLWHNYGGQMKTTMDEMIEEFNGTIGVKERITINVTSISGSSTLHDKLTMAANQDPGAPELPDITTAYPKTAMILADKDLLVNLSDVFTEKELSAFVPRFIEEGRLSDGNLYVLPTAKSTEVLFINSTIFNRFASESGAKLEDLSTFEGIAKTAALCYDWTDKKTPDIEGDGKTFYMPDSLFNMATVGCKQLGSDLFVNFGIDFNNPVVYRVWEYYFGSAVQGHTAIFDGYATDLAKTGEIVCSTGSTAGVLFYPENVTYPDNTTEPSELEILPYPVFEDGEKIAVQRGAGMCVIKSDKAKEKAAGIFLKWFTSPENNLHFVSSTGYLPVTEEAFGDIMLKEINSVSNPSIKKLLQVSRQMQMEYSFYIPPLFDGIDTLQATYENNLRALAEEARNAYQEQPNSLITSPDVLTSTNSEKYDEFKKLISTDN